MKKKIIIVFCLILIIVSSISFNVFNHSKTVFADAFDANAIVDNQLSYYLKSLAGSDNLTEDIFSSRTELVIKNSSIKNLTGLEQFDFTNLISLNLSSNKIDTLPSNLFAKMPNLVSVDLSNNLIKNVTFSSTTKLANISLFNNKIESINMSNINCIADIDLSNNALSSIDNIVFPNSANICNINLQLNSITDIPNPYSNVHNLNLGLQGAVIDGDYITPKTIAYYNIGDKFSNVSAKIFINNITNTELLWNRTLKSGSYIVKFYDDENIEIYDELDNTTDLYKPINFVVRPDISKVSISLDNVEVRGVYNIKEETTFDIICSDPTYTLKYRVNGSDFTTSTSFTISERGTFSIAVCAVEDGFESVYKTFYVKSNIGYNSGMSFLYVLLAAIGFTALVAGAYFYVNREKYFKRRKKKV